VEEYRRVLKDASDSSPGIDGMDRSYLRRIDADEVVAHMNLWLATGTSPKAFRVGTTSLIPKSAESKQPGEFRPITVSAIISRQFHRILAARFEQSIPLSPRQKAFRRGDGLADNVTILRSLLRDHCAKSHRICVAFIDVAKAFDSVSHHSMLAAARRLGVPELMLAYLESLYSDGAVSLKSGRQRGTSTYRVRRGVRQGDPLSPMLFNFVMDWLLSMLSPQLGVDMGAGVRVSHLAFADDLTLLSETPAGLQSLAADFEAGLASVGLLPNAKKSATLHISVSGSRKNGLSTLNRFFAWVAP
jgi:hypothetical protein